MKEDQIYPHICELTFANPSMETTNVFAFFVVISFMTYEYMKGGRLLLNSYFKKFLLYFTAALATAIIILVCI